MFIMLAALIILLEFGISDAVSSTKGTTFLRINKNVPASSSPTDIKRCAFKCLPSTYCKETALRFSGDQTQCDMSKEIKDTSTISNEYFTRLVRLSSCFDPEGCLRLSSDQNSLIIAKHLGGRVTTDLCDSVTDKGGWIVIQRRVDGSVDFYRSWNEYKNGFGDIRGNFWLGLDRMHCLTKNGNSSLRIDMLDRGKNKYAKYGNFSIGDEASEYVVQFDGFEGNVADDFGTHKGMKFSTFDRDNDRVQTNCAKDRKSGMWFNNCGYINPNGVYGEAGQTGFVSRIITGYSRSFEKLSMKIKKIG